MNGNMIVVHPDGRREERQLRATPDIDMLREAIGGPLQLIPEFTRYAHSTGMMRCYAFCNQEGKHMGLSINREATRLWGLSFGEALIGDVLVGPVVILFGDKDFMRAI